ncbi:MAG: DUF6568 family protein [Bacilli bacterium]
MVKKEIPRKNYYIVSIILIATLLIVITFVHFYKEFIKNEILMTDTIKEIKEVDLENFIIENPDIIIYLSNGTSKNFEKKFVNLIKENGLSKEIYYFNRYNKKVNQIFKPYLNNNESLLEIDNIILFENGKIKHILYQNKYNINENDVRYFLNSNEIIK